jgi:hypothetical protein
MNRRLRQGSASAAHTSGLLVTAQAGQRHWWIDAVFAVPSGGRSIHGKHLPVLIWLLLGRIGPAGALPGFRTARVSGGGSAPQHPAPSGQGRLREIAAEHIRWGRRMAYRLLRREGWAVNHKRVARCQLRRRAPI